MDDIDDAKSTTDEQTDLDALEIYDAGLRVRLLPTRYEEMCRYLDEHTRSRLRPRILNIEELLGEHRGLLMEMALIAVRGAAQCAKEQLQQGE